MKSSILFFFLLFHFTIQTDIKIDNTRVGRFFDGIGAISGGGATSKLLRTYNESVRNEILDYLFKPGFGCSLHLLKVEMGGDVQSTEGTEGSHMHFPGDENYNRGYEWWMMKEAKKRNPKIKLLGLPWGFPGWLGSGTPWANLTATATYVTKWILGAKKYHNLTIDYMGIWNEKPYNIEYVKTLRAMLNAKKLSNVKIIVGDGTWSPGDDALKDKSFADAFEVIGAHYPGTVSSASAKKTLKKLWSTEDYSTVNNAVGSGCWARVINQNYVNGLISSTIAWNLITSYYDHLPFPRASLMTANQPWSGHYEIPGPLWVTAHTTHFTQPGWIYLAHNNGVGHLSKGGSFVTLMSPDKKEFTLVIETMTYDQSACVRPYLWPYTVAEEQSVTIDVSSFAEVTSLHFYLTNITIQGNSSYFKRQSDITLTNKTFTLSIKANSLITLTSLPASNPPNAPPSSKSAKFPLPYSENFESYSENSEPHYITPQVGYFEVVSNPLQPSDKCLVQIVPEVPVHWCPVTLSAPMAVVGPGDWKSINASMSVMLPDKGSSGVFFAVRVDQGGCTSFMAKGLFVWLLKAENKFAITGDLVRSMPIYSKSMTVMTNHFYRINIIDKGTNADVFVDGDKLATVKSDTSAPTNGFVAMGTGNFGMAFYDNLRLQEIVEETSLGLAS